MDSGLTERFAQAAAWAAELHNDHLRKGTTIPYVSHLFAVASLVLEDGGDEDQAIAALLHDAVEDGKTTLDEIRSRYGDAVADIVAACSDTDVIPKPPWRERKENYLAHLIDPKTTDAALRVSNADKVHNARALVEDYQRWGELLWDRFNPDTRSADAQLWYYGSLADAFRRKRWTSHLASELDRLVQELRRLTTEPARYQATYHDKRPTGLFRAVGEPGGLVRYEAFVPRDGGWRHSPKACDMFMWDDISGDPVDEATAAAIARDFWVALGPA